MVGTRSRGRGKSQKHAEEDEEAAPGNGIRAQYEESRAQRIKENAERLKTLGILDLSKKLKRPSSSKSKPTSSAHRNKPPSNDPPRRSSRLKDMPRMSYSEKRSPKKESSSMKNVEIHIPEGRKPEIYTEEHEKLLGDCTAAWILYVDGYDEEGQRIYDPFEGKTCHQCRQKTLGQHTECSKCKIVTGQLCGDCLYTRYGENVLEVNQDPNWICPACRGICNCSRCRRDKGWVPTGQIYKKVVSLGFKSVAHYLIHTRHERAIKEMASGASISNVDGKEDLFDPLPLPPPSDKKDEVEGVSKKDKMGDDNKAESDEEYRGDDYEDRGNSDSEDAND